MRNDSRVRSIYALLETATVAQSEVNPSNRIITLSARAVIKADPFVHCIWKCRVAIGKNEPHVKVPHATLTLFQRYAKGIGSKSRVTGAHFEVCQPPFVNPRASLGVMYSGGSESVLMEAMYNGVELIQLYNFFPHTDLPREFQLNLVGMALGYGVTVNGSPMFANPNTRRSYDYSRDFIADWNQTFAPFTVQHPMGLAPSKDEVYRVLLKNGERFMACETPVNGKECGKCWHCAERYFYTLALRTEEEFANVALPRIDPKFLQHVRRCNRRNLAHPNNRFLHTTEMFMLLERKYGIVSWYREDAPSGR